MEGVVAQNGEWVSEPTPAVGPLANQPHLYLQAIAIDPDFRSQGLLTDMQRLSPPK